ncbi:MAG TPA: non-homologous end-joining DNA ligase [Nocardioidaceae bacterium]|nr:non-homologous end-joining DNA ligase [Nocardioidaceae bacterium]
MAVRPDLPAPALATSSDGHIPGGGWLFERKLDGMRVLADQSGERIRLSSRSGADASQSFPEIIAALRQQQAPDFVVDGEVVAFDGDQTSFARLQPRMHVSSSAKALRSGVEVFYYVFDLVQLDGHSLAGLPLTDRKDLLQELFDWQDPLRFSESIEGDGATLLDSACRQGWEGLIAKRADSPYRAGRTSEWLKLKCELGQEFVVGGWTDPQGARDGFGSLLLGYYDAAGALTYAGKVGTGFDTALLRSLAQRLKELARSETAYDPASLPRGAAWRSSVHWVEPELVAEVKFTEWTRDGQLRHPRFMGLRSDKAAPDVVREEPRPAVSAPRRSRRR